jgi:hypothetical protein
MQALLNPRLPETDFGQKTITTGIRETFTALTNFASIITTYERVVPELSLQAKGMLTKIEDFGLLQNNWDSYGAEPPIKEIIDRAKRFVRFSDTKRLPLFFTAPGPNGEIVVELNNKKDKDVEVYFNPEGGLEALFYLEKKLVEEMTTESYETVYDNIVHFFQRRYRIQ